MMVVGRKEACLGTGTGPNLVVWSANQRRNDVLLSFVAFLDTQTASYTVFLFKISQISSSDLTIIIRLLDLADLSLATPSNFSLPSSIPFCDPPWLFSSSSRYLYSIKNSRRSFSQTLDYINARIMFTSFHA